MRGEWGFQYLFVYLKLFNLKTFQTYLSSHIRAQLFWFRTSGNHFAWAWLHQGPRTSINIWLLTTPAREGHVTCGSFLLLCRFLSGEIIVRSLLACGRLFVCWEKRPYNICVFTYRSTVTFDILVMYRFHRYQLFMQWALCFERRVVCCFPASVIFQTARVLKVIRVCIFCPVVVWIYF